MNTASTITAILNILRPVLAEAAMLPTSALALKRSIKTLRLISTMA
jgi:hypothetical protein